MALTKDDIDHVAGLARLELTESEKEEFTRDLNAVFGLMGKLKQLDTAGMKPMSNPVSLQNVFRADRSSSSLGTDKVLANAPDRMGGFFKVPKILEDRHEVRELQTMGVSRIGLI